MADFNINQSQGQKQVQGQRLSQKQIQALNFLHMSTNDVRDAIYKAVEENPALEIVYDPKQKDSSSYDSYIKNEGWDASDRLQQAIENREDKTETLQSHLKSQLNLMKLSDDEYILCEKLINNLDKNGCYGSSMSPETFLDKAHPLQNEKMLNRCIERIQRMDPVGTCCKDLEESLYVQAKISGEASPLTLFILDGNLSIINPPEASSVLKKINDIKKELKKKEFGKPSVLEDIKVNEKTIEESISFILNQLNPRPAQGYTQDTLADYQTPDVVATVEPVPGPVNEDLFENGIIRGNEKYHFQVKYASGALPEVRISKPFVDAGDKKNVNAAKNFLDILLFRENSLVLQICAIVSAQRSFFLKGNKYLKPLTRKEIAERLGIHESTVSRLSSKKNSKYIQTHNGLYPLSFFFTSGLPFKGKNGERRISSEVVKLKIQSILENSDKTLSDNALTKELNDNGLKIARRTVAKYRSQIGIENSYKRDK